jgi:hypothetical protein
MRSLCAEYAPLGQGRIWGRELEVRMWEPTGQSTRLMSDIIGLHEWPRVRPESYLLVGTGAILLSGPAIWCHRGGESRPAIFCLPSGASRIV